MKPTGTLVILRGLLRYYPRRPGSSPHAGSSTKGESSPDDWRIDGVFRFT